MTENKYCHMIKEHQEIKPGTKTAWITTRTEESDIDRDTYEKIVDAAPFFRNLGGTERHTKSYTHKGYVVTRIVSTSPGNTNKSIYRFEFDLD